LSPPFCHRLFALVTAFSHCQGFIFE
jgi:hypothetical protein